MQTCSVFRPSWMSWQWFMQCWNVTKYFNSSTVIMYNFDGLDRFHFLLLYSSTFWENTVLLTPQSAALAQWTEVHVTSLLNLYVLVSSEDREYLNVDPQNFQSESSSLFIFLLCYASHRKSWVCEVTCSRSLCASRVPVDERTLSLFQHVSSFLDEEVFT